MSSLKFKIEASVEEFKNSLQSLRDMANGFSEGMLGALNPVGASFNAASWAAGKVKEAFNQIVESSKKLIAESRKFNMPIKDLQNLKAEADAAGVASGSLVRAFKGLYKAMADPASKKGKFFEELGIGKNDVDESRHNMNHMLDKMREVYQTLDEGSKMKFLENAFGGAGIQMKPIMDMTKGESEEVTASAFKMSEQTAIIGAGIGQSFKDIFTDLLELIEPLMPYIAIIIEDVKVLADTIELGLVQGFNAIKIVILEIQNLWTMFVYGLRSGGDMLMNLGNKLHLVSDESYKQYHEEYEKGKQELRSEVHNRNKTAYHIVDKEMNEANSKYEKRILASGHRMERSADAIADQWGGSGAAEKRKAADMEEIERLRKVKDERIKVELVKLTKLDELRERGLLNDDNYAKEKEKVDKKIEEHEKEFRHNTEDIATYWRMNSPDGSVHAENPVEEQKKYKSEFSKQKDEEKVAEDEAKNDKEKLLLINQDILNMEQELNSLQKNSNKEIAIKAALEKEIADQKSKSAKLSKKIEEDDKKAALQAEKEEEKLLRIRQGNVEKFNEIIEKDEIERMKKSGATEQQINAKLFEQRMAKFYREYEERDRLVEEANKNPTSANREAIARQEGKLGQVYGELQSSALELMNSGGQSITSSAAKKGMGGGISVTPQDKMNAKLSQQIEELVNIRKTLEIMSQRGIEGSQARLAGK